jgi:hypothetical protein
MNLRGVLFLLAATATAEAGDDIPVHSGLGGRLVLGQGFADGVGDAWLGRLEFEAFPVLSDRHHAGLMAGFTAGYEYWRSGPGTWGTGIPFQQEFGVRVFPFRATLGYGFYGFLVDRVKGDTGFGMVAPLASARAGFDVWGYTVMADARVTRRWQFGADDFTQWTFTVSVGFTFERGDD